MMIVKTQMRGRFFNMSKEMKSKSKNPGLILKGFEIVDLSTTTGIRAAYTGEANDPLVFQCLAGVNMLELLEDDGGYKSYVVETTTMRELEPNVFILSIRVREFVSQWKRSM
jgi:hypothetical protein